MGMIHIKVAMCSSSKVVTSFHNTWISTAKSTRNTVHKDYFMFSFQEIYSTPKRYLDLKKKNTPAVQRFPCACHGVITG
jgi:hypothetical protein